jgi:hypothetical protein
MTIFVGDMKNDYYISRQMQMDLIKAYNKVAQKSWTQMDAYMKAVKQPAPRYYVTAKQASQVISPMVRGDFSRVNSMQPNRKRMYYSLFEKVIELSEKRAFVGKSLQYILQFAVSSPAPEFFVSYHILRMLRSNILLGRVDDEGRIVNRPGCFKAYERMKKKRARKKACRERARKVSER